VNPELLFDDAIEEKSFRIEVAVLPERTEEFKEVVYAIGKKLNQRIMYFCIPEPSVYFMKVEDDLAS
jgi:hypothetical protein